MIRRRSYLIPSWAWAFVLRRSKRKVYQCEGEDCKSTMLVKTQSGLCPWCYDWLRLQQEIHEATLENGYVQRTPPGGVKRQLH